MESKYGSNFFRKCLRVALPGNSISIFSSNFQGVIFTAAMRLFNFYSCYLPVIYEIQTIKQSTVAEYQYDLKVSNFLNFRNFLEIFIFFDYLNFWIFPNYFNFSNLSNLSNFFYFWNFQIYQFLKILNSLTF